MIISELLLRNIVRAVADDELRVVQHRTEKRPHILQIEVQRARVENTDLLVQKPLVRQFQTVLPPEAVPLNQDALRVKLFAERTERLFGALLLTLKVNRCRIVFL